MRWATGPWAIGNKQFPDVIRPFQVAWPSYLAFGLCTCARFASWSTWSLPAFLVYSIGPEELFSLRRDIYFASFSLLWFTPRGILVSAGLPSWFSTSLQRSGGPPIQCQCLWQIFELGDACSRSSILVVGNISVFAFSVRGFACLCTTSFPMCLSWYAHATFFAPGRLAMFCHSSFFSFFFFCIPFFSMSAWG